MAQLNPNLSKEEGLHLTHPKNYVTQEVLNGASLVEPIWKSNFLPHRIPFLS
jgi:hypothetical protein